MRRDAETCPCVGGGRQGHVSLLPSGVALRLPSRLRTADPLRCWRPDDLPSSDRRHPDVAYGDRLARPMQWAKHDLHPQSYATKDRGEMGNIACLSPRGELKNARRRDPTGTPPDVTPLRSGAKRPPPMEWRAEVVSHVPPDPSGCVGTTPEAWSGNSPKRVNLEEIVAASPGVRCMRFWGQTLTGIRVA
jgi:hypothetical protein